MNTKTILIVLMVVIVLGVLIFFITQGSKETTTTTTVSDSQEGLLSGVGGMFRDIYGGLGTAAADAVTEGGE